MWYFYVCMHAQSCPALCDPMAYIALQAPMPFEFSRQKYQSGLPCPPSGYLPNPGIKPASLETSSLAGGFFTTVPPGKSPFLHEYLFFKMMLVLNHLSFFLFIPATGPALIYPLRIFDSLLCRLTDNFEFSQTQSINQYVICYTFSCITNWSRFK